MSRIDMSQSSSLTYLVCATPRSGSTLLCEALRHTGLAGKPDEYFGPMHVERWNKEWRTQSAGEYLERVRRQGCGANGVWGAKIMRLYWRNFVGQLGQADKERGGSPLVGGESLSQTESDLELLRRVFPRLHFVFITRRHKIRQAVSWLKFIQGMAWFWEKDKPQVLGRLEFRPEVIDGFLRQTALHESAWLEFFRRAGVQPHIVVYEDLAADYEQTAKGVLDYLGVEYPPALRFKKRRLRQQADTISDEWVERYLALNETSEFLAE
jgi:trehalose 2-sulfotransferase